MNWEKDKEEAVRIYALGTNDSVDEKLVDNTLAGKGFSFCAGLFSPLYLAYRKMYKLALLTLVGEYIILGAIQLLKLPSNVDMGISAIIFMLYGFFFYPLYQNHIKKVYENCADQQNWRDELRTKGGTNGWIILAYLGLILVLWLGIWGLVNMGILK